MKETMSLYDRNLELNKSIYQLIDWLSDLDACDYVFII